MEKGAGKSRGQENGRALDERLEQAASFLREAVFASRARQAAGVALAGIDLEGPPGGPGTGGCGLGEKAAIELELSATAAAHFARLWPEAPTAAELERIRTVMRDWIVLQDGLDRARNHFLRDFRREHGADREAWSAGMRSAYEEGLAALHARMDARLREHAERLTGAARA